MVGSGQLYVVQRLSPRELDVAGVEKVYRPRPRALAGRRAQETCLHQRGQALRHGDSTAVTGGVPVGRRSLGAATAVQKFNVPGSRYLSPAPRLNLER